MRSVVQSRAYLNRSRTFKPKGDGEVKAESPGSLHWLSLQVEGGLSVRTAVFSGPEGA